MLKNHLSSIAQDLIYQAVCRFTGPQFPMQENGHKDAHHSLGEDIWTVSQSPRGITSSAPEVPKGKRMKLSLGK